ncbi:hypothetical protein ACVWZ8_001399 [Arthrobacter sp. UYCu723]
MTSFINDDDAPATDAPAAAGEPAKHTGTKVDRPRIEAAVREILLAIGEDPDRSGLVDTPKRVAKAYTEMFAGLHHDPAEILATTFELDHEELVLVKDIPFYSTCEHHLVPFHGVAHVGYIPSHDGKVTGLSKLAPGGGYVRQAPAGAGTADHPDRRSPRHPPQTARRDRRRRMRTPLHVHARHPQARRQDRHQCGTRATA